MNNNELILMEFVLYYLNDSVIALLSLIFLYFVMYNSFKFGKDKKKEAYKVE